MQNPTPHGSSSILKYNPQLDGLRFIAIFFVVCYHWLPSVHHSKKAAFFGGLINFFFVLSSYLITRILFSAKEKAATLGIAKPKVMAVFLLRRTIRIFPAYYLFLLILLLLPAIGSEVRDNAGMYFSYLANYHMFQTHDFSSVTAHIWTLAVEEQFYFVWPFIILFVPQRHLLKTFIFIVIATVAARAILYYPAQGIPQAILTQYCADAFAIGGIMAYKYTIATDKEKAWISRAFKIGLYAGIPVCICIMISKSYYLSFVVNRLLFSVISFAIIEGAVKQYKNFFGKFLENKRVLYIGRISYGIYLYHLMVPVIFWKVYHEAFLYFKTNYAGFYAAHRKAIGNFEIVISSQLGCFVIYATLVLIIASLSAKFIEGPMNKLKVGYNPGSKNMSLNPSSAVK
ncbi:MAG: acyltransferase [Bacteroidota bacterium]